ncbi:MAG: phage Gp37/Gp68 family protein [Nitrospirae bacterium]|nr:phage Gp37/Gp68 family protein [Nitrospirota bacterium]
MSEKSRIEWTETTWNPVTGCTKISKGCLNCYAERLALRLKAMGVKKYSNGFDVTIHRKELCRPYEWRQPSRIFVNSMGDLFHDDVPLSFIEDVFRVMNDNKAHVFQILTKRSERLLEISDKLNWSENIWMGVTIEAKEYLYRLKHLTSTRAKVKFISFEPLLSDMGSIDLQGADWVIVGGESGPMCRQVLPRWIEKIRDICIESNIPFFFKQWGGVFRTKSGRLLDGKTWDDIPAYNNTGTLAYG